MEQNTQSNENNSQTEVINNNGQIFNNPEKKDNKKAVLLAVIVVAVVLGIVASYFLFFSDKKNDNTPVLENEKVEEIKINKELDSDQDGLPDYIEKVLRTDLNNPDTDGDGYSDFEEVKNGYDPLGDKKWTEEEWEAVKEKIRGEDEKIYQSIFNYSSLEKKMNEALIVCQKIANSKSKDYCIALIKGDFSICEDKLEEGLSKDTCYYSMANITKDISLCEKISYKDFCLAVLTGDYEKCKMTNNEDDCYKEIALLTKDFLGCERISDKKIFNICSAYTKLDVSFCEEFERMNDKEYCYINIAKVKGNSSLCDTIQSDKKEMCIAIADRNKNNLDCAKYPTQCGDLASITEDVSICDSIPTRSDLYSTYQNNCYINVAEHILTNF